MPRNLDTSGIGKLAAIIAQKAIHESGHILQFIDGDVDKSIDGYIRIRKRVVFEKVIKNKKTKVEDLVDTGDLVGIQIKGVSEIPASGSRSYYITLKDKSKFGVNFKKPEILERHKSTWANFVGPVIIVFVDLKTEKCWWVDTKSSESYGDGGYSVIIKKEDILDAAAFKKIKKLGKELFVKNTLPEIHTENHYFPHLSLSGFKESARDVYDALGGNSNIPFLFIPETIHHTLGKIKFSLSGWKHITRRDRRKMRIFNSLILLPIIPHICNNVRLFTTVKRGNVRESNRFIKKVEYLTLRAMVHFNFRQSSIIQVVLRRVKTFDKLHTSNFISDEVFFHSIYEPYRKE